MHQANLNPLQFMVAVLLAAMIAVVGYRGRALSRSGALAAILVGTMTFGFGGWLAAILLVTFFLTSSILSRFGKQRKHSVATEFAKGGQRDHGQVLANGAVASTFSVLYGLTGQVIWMACLAGALAAVNADTWSTELGVLAKRWPRLITNGTRVAPGTSGGVTLEGNIASLLGAALIGGIASIGVGEFGLGIAVMFAGFLGSILDSLLGASVQAIYYCPSCEKQTEHHPLHTCGTSTTHARGWHWLSNDLVNFIASVVGAVFSGLIWWLI